MNLFSLIILEKFPIISNITYTINNIKTYQKHIKDICFLHQLQKNRQESLCLKKTL